MGKLEYESTVNIIEGEDIIQSMESFIEMLYVEYDFDLYNVIRKITYNKNDYVIQAIKQNVYVVAIENYFKIKDYNDIKGWLIVTAINKTSNYNRKYIKRNKILEYKQEIINTQVDDNYLIEQIRYNEFIRLNVMKYIFAQLNKKDLKLYYLSCIKDNTLEDVAIHLNISRKCANTRLWRLKKKVLKSIKTFARVNKI